LTGADPVSRVGRVGIRRVLVLGSGGREHALAWRLARDPDPPEVLVAPGPDGLAAPLARLDLAPDDAAAVVRACRDARVDLVVVGPEGPLAAGLVDALEAAGILTFGPRRAAAALESSKSVAKELMREAGVPTARAERCDDPAAARAALARFGPPYVVKADGLAAGKGVVVTSERVEAERFAAECLSGARFGEAGRSVLIEEHLSGVEVSLIAVTDGRRWRMLPAARDFKRARDGDVGGNTGGMGALAPAAEVTPTLAAEVGERILAPVLGALERRGTPFRGALYAGLMLTRDGPKVIEFNVRFGDPETQVLLPLLGGRFTDLLASAAAGALEPGPVAALPGAAVAVAIVDEGYPEGIGGVARIEGLDAVARRADTLVFHAGVRREDGDRWRVTGGRAAWVVGLGADLATARDRAYSGVANLGGSGWRCRSDIAAARSAAPPLARAS
jgi:phosphoribosylamine--glycine ligase